MAKMPGTIEVQLKTNLRVEHKVLYADSSLYKNALQGACATAQADGFVLTGIVPAESGYVVLVFIGAEDFVNATTEDG